MEAKLKALKVADLKEILSKASVSVAARTNKQDLIAKILASPPAIKVYEARYPSSAAASTKAPAKPAPVQTNNDDLLAPPEVLDWNFVEAADLSPVAAPAEESPSPKQSPPAKPVPPTKPPTKTPAVTATPAPAPTPSPTAPKTNQAAPVDDELAKRRARAERFGIPLVEPKKAPQPRSQPKQNVQTRRAAAPADDPEKMGKRADRFGLSTSKDLPAPARRSTKRGAPTEEVDEEEMERRRKRAERFKIPPT